MKYESLGGVPCDCSQESVAWAAGLLAEVTSSSAGTVSLVSQILTLHVSPHGFRRAREIARELNGQLPPQVNVVIDYELLNEEWYLADHRGKAIGSSGV